MNLTDEQTQTVRQWLEEGLSVADVQTKLSEELKISMTYMEVRFLLDDLKLAPQDEEEEESALEENQAETEDTAPSAAAPAGDKPAEEAELVSDGNVAVTVDDIVRPGCLASGKATFTDGKQATWYFDQFGRLGLIPEEEGYQPPEADVAEFQKKLQSELARLGI
ncbi:MAG: hypothetical protein ACPGVU_27100 [Limisphaerales bacterium]